MRFLRQARSRCSAEPLAEGPPIRILDQFAIFAANVIAAFIFIVDAMAIRTGFECLKEKGTSQCPDVKLYDFPEYCRMIGFEEQVKQIEAYRAEYGPCFEVAKSQRPNACRTPTVRQLCDGALAGQDAPTRGEPERSAS